jgi:hypothetical protein
VKGAVVGLRFSPDNQTTVIGGGGITVVQSIAATATI